VKVEEDDRKILKKMKKKEKRN